MWQLQHSSLGGIEIQSGQPIEIGRHNLGSDEDFPFVSRKQLTVLDESCRDCIRVEACGRNDTLVRRAGKLIGLAKGQTTLLSAGDEVIFDKKKMDRSIVYVLHRPPPPAAEAETEEILEMSASTPEQETPASAAEASMPAPPAAEPSMSGPARFLPPQAYRLTRISRGWGARLDESAVGLEDLLSDAALEGALEVQLHSYLLDLDWIVQSCPALCRVPRVLCVHGDGLCEHANCLTMPEHAGRFTLLAPPTPSDRPGHVFHSKLIVVRSAARLQLHVTSANLVCSDFIAKSNAVWSGDFPPKATATAGGGGPSISSAPPPSGFEADLFAYMDALRDLGQIPPSSFYVRHKGQGCQVSALDATAWDCFGIEWIRTYDYASAKGCRLIASVPARNQATGHIGSALHAWGQGRLRALLGHVEASRASVGLPLVLQFSSMSLANNSLPWLRQMAKSFCPHDSHIPPVRVVYPTTQEVRDSLEGWAAGASIPCHDGRPARSVLETLTREERSFRPGYSAFLCKWAAGEKSRAVPHLKSFTRCADHDASTGPTGCSSGGGGGDGNDLSGDVGVARAGLKMPWAVLGSHNFSKSAWGELNATGSALTGMSSYELSVLVVPTQLPAGVETPPLPYLPPTRYAGGDTIWTSLWKSTSVTDGLPDGIAGSSGSVDHHGRRPEDYLGQSTLQLIYGEDAAAHRLLKAKKRKRAAAPAEPMDPLSDYVDDATDGEEEHAKPANHGANTSGTNSSGGVSTLYPASPPLFPKLDTSFSSATRHQYVVIGFVQEDAATARLLQVLKGLCDPIVQAKCFQWDGTRHFTLYELGELSEAEASRVRLASQPQLPVTVQAPRLWDWPTCLALGVDSAGTDAIHAAIPLLDQASLPKYRAIPEMTKELHVSLYRRRNQIAIPMMKYEVGRMRAALSARAGSGIFGAVTITHIGIKIIKEDYAKTRIL